MKNSKITGYIYRWVALISLIVLTVCLINKCCNEISGYHLAKYGTPDTSTDAIAVSDSPSSTPAEAQPAETSPADQPVDLSEWSAICDNGLEHYGNMPPGSFGREISRTFQITEDSTGIYHLNMWDATVPTPFWRKDCFGTDLTFTSLSAAQICLRIGVDKLLDEEVMREERAGQF